GNPMSKIKRFFEICILVIIGYILRFGFSLRYKIKVVGRERLNKKNLNKPGGILFLPNHVTVFAEPTITVNYLWLHYQIRPMVVEYMYRIPGFHYVLKLQRPVVVPNFDTGTNSYKKKQLQVAFDEVLEALRNKDNFIIYPAARTKSSSREVIRSSGV